jgi:hypothetical protein
MGQYCTKQNTVDKLCDALASRDTMQRSFLSGTAILEAFKVLKMPLNSAQMAKITAPLPVDPLDSSYNYVIMVELLFGKNKAFDVQQKYKLGEIGASIRDNQTAGVNLQNQRVVEMSQRFKDQVEVKLGLLQNIVHQVSKGSYLLREQEFGKVFRQVGIVVTSQDHDLLTQAFH